MRISTRIGLACGMLSCAGIYLFCIWAGSRPGVGEDLGPYLYPSLAAGIGFFCVPIVAVWNKR